MILSMVVFTSLSHHAGDMSSHSLRAWGEGGGDGGGEGDGGGGDGGGLRRERRKERNSTTSATSTADAALAPLRRNMRRVFMGRRAGRTTECSRRRRANVMQLMQDTPVTVLKPWLVGFDG